MSITIAQEDATSELSESTFTLPLSGILSATEQKYADIYVDQAVKHTLNTISPPPEVRSTSVLDVQRNQTRSHSQVFHRSLTIPHIPKCSLSARRDAPRHVDKSYDSDDEDQIASSCCSQRSRIISVNEIRLLHELAQTAPDITREERNINMLMEEIVQYNAKIQEYTPESQKVILRWTQKTQLRLKTFKKKQQYHAALYGKRQ